VLASWKLFSPQSLADGPFAGIIHFLYGLVPQQKAYQNDRPVYQNELIAN
jgi:hypothetical protein